MLLCLKELWFWGVDEQLDLDSGHTLSTVGALGIVYLFNTLLIEKED